MAITIDAVELAKNEVGISVKIKSLRKLSFRFWLASKFIWLANLATWGMVELEDDTRAISLMEELGENGITTSVCYGPMANKSKSGWSLGWSVLCRNDNLEEFERPFLANSFEHCVDIAQVEARERGWIE